MLIFLANDVFMAVTLLLRAHHARIEVFHFLAGCSVHARQIVQGGNHGQTVKKLIVFPCQFKLECLQQNQFTQKASVRRLAYLGEPVWIFILR